MGVQGEVDEIHGSLEWRAKGDSGERYVTVSPRDGIITIRSSANLTNAAVVTFLPAGLIGVSASVVALMAAANNASAVGMVIGLGILPTVFASLRAFFGRISAKESVKLQRVVDELARLAEGSLN
jgi:hypothetical protein